MRTKVKFKELWIGDRFLAHNGLWTKISKDTARQHCERELNLKERGWGYIGSAHCSFEEPEYEVEFVPATT